MSVPASFSVSGTTGILGSWLSSTTSAANAASLLGGGASSGNALTALQLHAGSTAAATTNALVAGELTNSQHRVIQAIGDNTGPLQIPWNANGTEPTTVANIRNAGWIKLDKKVSTGGKVTGATYELTPVGKAIFKRTGGGNVDGSDSALTSADTNGPSSSSGGTTAAAAQAALQNGVSALSGLLGSLGVSV